MSSKSVDRFLALDITRGFLVFLMISGHTIFFTYQGLSVTIHALSGLANIICFTGFVFISGMVSYLAYLHSSHPLKSVTARLCKRLFIYTLGYYLLSAFALLVKGSFNLSNFIGILSFTQFLPFTEFIPTFLLFSLLNLLCRVPLRLLTRSFKAVIFGSVLLYVLGLFFYRFPIPYIPLGWQALLAGIPGWYTFPLLFYFPVYLIGIYISHQIVLKRLPLNIQQQFLHVSAAAAAWLLGSSLVALIFKINLAAVNHRWPPSPSFLALGCFVVGLLFYFAYSLYLHRTFLSFQRWFSLLGQNAFALYICHTGLLFIYQRLHFPLVSSVFLLGALIIISMWLALWLAKILPLNYHYGLTVYSFIEDYRISPVEKRQWHRTTQQLFDRLGNIPNLFTVSVGHRHLKIVHHRTLAALTVLLFIAAGPVGLTEEYLLVAQSLPHLSGSTNKEWYLSQDESVTYSIPLPQGLFTHLTKPGEAIVDHRFHYPLFISGDTWQAIIPLQTLSFGEHSVEAQLSLYNRSFTIKPTSFKFSAPLYVTWTIDWEGYDVPPPFLQALANTAFKHQLVMTHLFNPRIYTDPTMSNKRAADLTAWVKQRHSDFNEEIGLHLHMFPDLIEKSGIEPKLSPVWGGGFTPGYDILTTTYNQNEFEQILLSAKDMFYLHGLPEPKSFRAGAWFANIDTLTALQNTGFIIDSSGRSSYVFGTNQTSGPWHLTPDTQPYFPSVFDQNNSSPPPTLNIMEIPNNGADDYAFSAQEMIARFDQNFNNQPLQSGRQVTYLSHPQWFDPKRQQKMDDVFTYVSNYSAVKGTGPVLFTTLSGVYEAFK